MTVAGPAAVFARKHRQQLFPDTPLLFASVDQRFLRDAPLGENETAVAVVNDFPGLVDDILQLLPETRQVFMVMGSGAARPILASSSSRTSSSDFTIALTFIWSDDLSLPEILRRCASLPDQLGDLLSHLRHRRAGRGVCGRASARRTSRHGECSPVCERTACTSAMELSAGRLMSIDDLSRSTADVAIRILNGAPPASVRVPPQLPGQPIFDWRELQRWGIPESRLPPGSVVRYRRSEPVGRIQAHGSERGRRAGSSNRS